MRFAEVPGREHRTSHTRVAVTPHLHFAERGRDHQRAVAASREGPDANRFELRVVLTHASAVLTHASAVNRHGETLDGIAAVPPFPASRWPRDAPYVVQTHAIAARV